MEFGLSEEQILLKDSITRYLSENSAIERIHSFTGDNESRAEDLWAGLCDLGLPGLLIGEEHGGVGLDLLDAALVAETLGQHVAPAPFVASMRSAAAIDQLASTTNKIKSAERRTRTFS